MKLSKDAAVLITASNSYFVWSATCGFSLADSTRRRFIGSPLTPMFHPFCQWADHVFSIRSTWQRWNTGVILAPSCNLDVYINYFYNQLTHTHTLYWKCVGMCACVLFFSECVFLCLFCVCKVGAGFWGVCRSVRGSPCTRADTRNCTVPYGTNTKARW